MQITQDEMYPPYQSVQCSQKADGPSVQSPTTPNQYNLLRNEDIPSTDRPPRGPSQLIKPKCTELYYTKEALSPIPVVAKS